MLRSPVTRKRCCAWAALATTHRQASRIRTRERERWRTQIPQVDMTAHIVKQEHWIYRATLSYDRFLPPPLPFHEHLFCTILNVSLSLSFSALTAWQCEARWTTGTAVLRVPPDALRSPLPPPRLRKGAWGSIWPWNEALRAGENAFNTPDTVSRAKCHVGTTLEPRNITKSGFLEPVLSSQCITWSGGGSGTCSGGGVRNMWCHVDRDLTLTTGFSIETHRRYIRFEVENRNFEIFCISKIFTFSQCITWFRGGSETCFRGGSESCDTMTPVFSLQEMVN